MNGSRNRRGLLALTLSALVAVALAVPLACSSDDGGKDGSSSGSGDASGEDRDGGSGGSKGSEDDSGDVVTEPGPIRLSVGEEVTIRLESNRTTGYQWTAVTEPDAAVATVVSTSYRPGDSDAVGAGGTQDFVVRGVAAGTTTLELGYSRPWEEGTPPAQTASFPITVT